MDKAIKTLDEHFKNHALYNKVVALSGRMHSFNLKTIEGDLSTEDTFVQENKIRNSVLKLLDLMVVEESNETVKNVDRKLGPNAIVGKVLEMLDKTKYGFKSQLKLRDTLYQSLRSRIKDDVNIEYEDFFKAHYAEMSAEEKEFHRLIRSYTKDVLNKYNRKVLELILGNDELSEAIPELIELERHLLVWLGKYERVFESSPSISLVYTGPSEGVPFPFGIESVFTDIICFLFLHLARRSR